MTPAPRDTLRTAFLTRAGWGDARRVVLAGDASFRRYDRLTAADGAKAVLMDAPPPQEDVRPFIRIARHLAALGYSAPRLLAEDVESGFLLLEDLGDATYTRALAEDGDEESLYGLAVDVLADLHGRADAIPAGLPAYDDDRLLTEAGLLTEWYWPAVTGQPCPEELKRQWRDLWHAVLPVARAMPDTLVLRDFHVDNLMRLDRPGLAGCGLLDFQDAVAGPLTYDLLSLLEDARRDIDPGLVERMVARYLRARPGLDPDAFAASWAVLAAQRHAKVIGIFTRLSRRDGKPAYLVHLPRVWRLLERALRHPALADIARWLDHHLPAESRVVPAHPQAVP